MKSLPGTWSGERGEGREGDGGRKQEVVRWLINRDLMVSKPAESECGTCVGLKFCFSRVLRETQNLAALDLAQILS